ncbi:nucleoside triphosphate pyrophosphohydrolase [Candidatus Kaiserbacteria bacterium]|nr:MAG: nucleoside triphosphate pyrophosphohydrolase [Candidatus Kaiserbacteria bacterium]
MKKRYGKLVRDNVPDIIRANGEMPTVRTLETDGYRKELLYKLIEESEEARQSGFDDENKNELLRELTDVAEVLDAILVEFGITKEELQTAQDAKRKERGGFKNKVFLESVKEK